MPDVETFTWHDEPLVYLDHPYNSTRLNERAVEVPIARSFLDGRSGAGLEIGNVLSHYQVVEHRVVDLYEQGPGVENLDVRDLSGSYDWIVAISTLEHVGWDTDPRDPDAAAAAVSLLLDLTTDLLVTVPLGYHPSLDESIRSGALAPTRDCVFVRDGLGWVQETRRTWRPYGATTRWAEAVWIGEWVR